MTELPVSSSHLLRGLSSKVCWVYLQEREGCHQIKSSPTQKTELETSDSLFCAVDGVFPLCEENNFLVVASPCLSLVFLLALLIHSCIQQAFIESYLWLATSQTAPSNPHLLGLRSAGVLLIA